MLKDLLRAGERAAKDCNWSQTPRSRDSPLERCFGRRGEAARLLGIGCHKYVIPPLFLIPTDFHLAITFTVVTYRPFLLRQGAQLDNC